MGTNFYIKKYKERYIKNNGTDDYGSLCDYVEDHIGKRSAAGSYCFDCDVTLCKGGIRGVHFSEFDFFENCPHCGKKYEPEELDKSSAGLELGFNKNNFKKKKGVKSCSSFTFGMGLFELKQKIKKYKMKLKDKCIENEYGDLYSYKEFLDILKDCPIKYTGSIGEKFA